MKYIKCSEPVHGSEKVVVVQGVARLQLRGGRHEPIQKLTVDTLIMLAEFPL